jgi:hypothetical protein
VRPGRRAPVAKTFRRFEPDQVLLLPPSPDEWLPEGHLARFVAELVDEALDLGPLYADYTEGRGFPPRDPRLMVRLLVYGYVSGVRPCAEARQAPRPPLEGAAAEDLPPYPVRPRSAANF